MKNQYSKTNKIIDLEIEKILHGNYQEVILGSINQRGYPFLSKTVPLYYRNKVFFLLSDLSEHTQNIKKNSKISIYYSLPEKNKQKLNNPRLTIVGKIKDLNLKKNNKSFIELLDQYTKLEKGAKLWGQFDDFNFYSMNILKLLYIKGFGKAYSKNFN